MQNKDIKRIPRYGPLNAVFATELKIHALPKKPANGGNPAKLIANIVNNRLSDWFHNNNIVTMYIVKC